MDRDAAGNEITVGSFVTYIGSIGNSSLLNFGLVVKMPEYTDSHWDNPGQHATRVDYKRRAVQILSAAEKRGGVWSLLGRVSKSGHHVPYTIHDYRKVLVVRQDQVHPQALKLLRDEQARRNGQTITDDGGTDDSGGIIGV